MNQPKTYETLLLEAQLMLAQQRYAMSKYMPPNMESYTEQRASWFYQELLKERMLMDQGLGDKRLIDWLCDGYNRWTMFKKDLTKQGEKSCKSKK